jgi:STIP1 family protein 1
MCRLNTKQLDGAVADCEKCLSVDPKNMKAHYLLAKARLELGDASSASEAARAAYDLCRLQQDDGSAAAAARASLDMTLQLLLQCRRARWDALERARRRENDDLQREVMALLARDREEALADAQGEMERAEIEEESARKRTQMEAVFERSRAEDDRKRELPDWLIDDISFNVMVDPVVVSLPSPQKRLGSPSNQAILRHYIILTASPDKDRQILRARLSHGSSPKPPR